MVVDGSSFLSKLSLDTCSATKSDVAFNELTSCYFTWMSAVYILTFSWQLFSACFSREISMRSA